MRLHIRGLVQDCSNSIANTLGLLQACTKPSNMCSLRRALGHQQAHADHKLKTCSHLTILGLQQTACRPVQSDFVVFISTSVCVCMFQNVVFVVKALQSQKYEVMILAFGEKFVKCINAMSHPDLNTHDPVKSHLLFCSTSNVDAPPKPRN